MVSFQYSFQKIVDLKSNEKTQAEWMLSAAFGKLREEESSLTLLEQEKREVQESLSEATEQPTTVSELTLYQAYLSHIENRIHSKHRDVQTAQEAVNERQSLLTEKMKQEKVWFMARDKAHRVFTAAQLKKEQESLDEMAVTRFKRLS